MPHTDLNSRNPYLHGLYAPVSQEVNGDHLTVTAGEIPRDLHGGFFRNGPNPKSAPQGMHHWFDGDGMIHGVWFENGAARYRNRYVKTQDYKDNAAPLNGIFEPAHAVDGRKVVYKDTANTDLVFHNGKLLALWYISGQPVAVDAETLDTIRTENFEGQLPGNISAHSKVDPETGELVFFDYALYEPKMWTGAVSANGALTHFQEIDLPGPRLPHDMGMTENYVILHDLPVIFSDQAIKNRMWQIHVANQPTRFGVVSRKGGDAKWFEFPTCYVYHVINSWEDGDEVVMAACKMVPNGFDPDPQYGPYAAMVDVLALRAQPFLWRMNMKTGEGREEQLDDALSEFPVVNNALAGRRTRYSYHVVFDDCIPQRFSGLMKYDLETGASSRHNFPRGVYGSEPAFAPRVGATDEDDGYIITLTASDNGQSEAHIIDARNFSEPPIARIALPQRIPIGFHGVWAQGV